MIEHKDRISQFPGRVALAPVAGQPNVFDLTRADAPLQEGALYNKAMMDEFLAASGVTIGAASALILAQAGFQLADGAPIRFRLHLTPNPGATINVGGTGAKKLVDARGKPAKGMSAGAWVSAVYSAALGFFVLQGSAGGALRFGNDPGQISAYQFIAGAWTPDIGI